jgi:hypothetical protein
VTPKVPSAIEKHAADARAPIGTSLSKKGGIMVLPKMMPHGDWERIAIIAQQRLIEEVRK